MPPPGAVRAHIEESTVVYFGDLDEYFTTEEPFIFRVVAIRQAEAPPWKSFGTFRERTIFKMHEILCRDWCPLKIRLTVWAGVHLLYHRRSSIKSAIFWN